MKKVFIIGGILIVVSLATCFFNYGWNNKFSEFRLMLRNVEALALEEGPYYGQPCIRSGGTLDGLNGSPKRLCAEKCKRMGFYRNADKADWSTCL